MTNTRILFTEYEDDDQKQQLKPIQFLQRLLRNADGEFATTISYPNYSFPAPKDFDRVELIGRIGKKLDIMRAYCENDTFEDVQVYIGRWNDGVVE